MGERNEVSMFIDPEILQKELVISLPILSESDIEMMINGVNSSTDDDSSSSSVGDEKEKPCLKREQRRFNLLNDPNYGIILCFMEKFRAFIDLKKYPLRIFEDNLINELKISGRFKDFHLALLKKISSGKSVERNQFVPSMTKFAYRFNRDDGEHLEEYGYSKARIDTKLRILKNLLEQQFDRNQALKTDVADKPSFDISSKPFGRDRFGASYWLFIDTDCFIRLFRENIDANRTWTNLAKNPQELENIIRSLITDSIVRKKFPEWKFSYQSFNDLPLSNKFEEDYAPDFVVTKEKPKELNFSSVLLGSSFIKTEHINLDPIVNLDRDISTSSFLMNDIQIKNILDITSDQESINSEEINANRLNSSSSSNDTRDEIYSRGSSPGLNEKKQDQISKPDNTNTTEIIPSKPSLEQGIKRKLVDYDDTESDIESEKNEEPSQDLHQTPVNEKSENTADLPIALRRSKRNGRSYMTAELSPDSSNTSDSFSQGSTKRKMSNGKSKNFNQSSRTNGRRQHGRRRSRKSPTEGSSTTSDDRQPTDDDEDDLPGDYFPNNTELDKLLNGDFLEEDDEDDDYIPRRTAKTVAQYHDFPQIQSKPCSICSQSNRPEYLLLCENCNDAYHLECIKPELFSIPDDDWFCPLCEHKRLCDNLIEKLIILLKDEKDFEMKRLLYVSKRRKRLTNVTVNLDRYIKQPPKMIVSSDDDKQSEKKTISTIDDDDDDSVYGCKNDENRKPSDQEVDDQQPGKRRVRSCRQKPKNYSLDDYDKKIKKAMIDAGVNKELVENDSDDSDDIILKRRPPKKRARYEQDDDFNMSDGKNGDKDFAPSRRRTINDNSRTINDDSRSDPRDDYDDFDDLGMSDDDSAWKDRRQSSASSSISKKKIKQKSNQNNQRKPPIVSDEDTIPYDPDTIDTTPTVNIKSEPTVQLEKNDFSNNVFNKPEIVKNVYDRNRIVENIVYTNEAANLNKPRRPARRPPRRTASKKKKEPIQEENISDEEEDGDNRPPPVQRLPRKRRRDSNDSSPDDDDDYEKLAHKRRLFHHGKVTTRTSITKHIKTLVGDEDDEEEEEEEDEEEKKVEEENGTEAIKDKPDKTKKDNNNNSKKENKNLEYEEFKLSDDDDFPDDQEILKTTGLINLKKPLNGPKAIPFRAPFMPSMQSYQFAMIDPTAQFEFTCPPEPPMTEPSDSTQTNGDNNLTTAT